MLTTIAVLVGVLLAVLLILCLILLFVSAKLEIQIQQGDLFIRLLVLGICIYRYPEKKKLQKHPPKAKNSTPKKSKHPLSLAPNAKPEVIFSFLKALFDELINLFPLTKATLYRLWMTPPAAEEAAMAALLYTGASAAAAGFLELLDRSTKLSIHSRDAISISPNFTQEKAAFSLHLTLSIKGYRALLALGNLGKRLEEIQN